MKPQVVTRKRVHRTTEQLMVGLFISLIALFGFAWAMGRSSYDVFGAALIAPVLVLLTIPLAFRSARKDDDPAIKSILMLALAAKFAGSLLRFYVAYDTYGGTADAYTYHLFGAQLAASIRSGHFAIPSAPLGTQFIMILTGIVYAAVGTTKLGGFLLFAWLGFMGQFLFYRAFRIAFPTGDSRRYALLIFFLPSEVFWPSSLGKDAWMALTLGMFAFGAAKLLVRQRGAFIWMALGLWGAGAVRPHIALIAAVAVGVVYPFRRGNRERPSNPAVKATGLLFMGVIAFLALQKASSFFGVQSLDPQTVNKVLQTTQKQTSLGGSQFQPISASNPIHFPQAIVTVLFRPFPFEGHNFQGVLAGFEGFFLMCLLLFGWRRFRRLPSEMLRTSYILFCVVYVLAFVFAFSNIGNFGILVRERVQVFPFLLVLYAIPAPPRERPAPKPRPTLRYAQDRA